MVFFRLLRGLLALLLILPGASPAAQAQGRLNLGLEPSVNYGYPLAFWATRKAAGGRVQFDSTVFRQGRGSLRFTLAGEEERVFMAAYTSRFPLDSVRGQIATVSGWVRTRGFRGRAGVYAFAHTPTTLGFSSDRSDALDSLPVNTDWRRLELRLPVKLIADEFGIGIQAYGSGQVWFDELQVRVGTTLLGTALLAGTTALLLSPAEALTPNWDFERPLPPLAHHPIVGSMATLDSVQPQHGRRYLQLARVPSGLGPAPIFYLGTLRLAPELPGKSLQVKGYWRQPLVNLVPGASPEFSYALLGQDQVNSNYSTDSPAHWSTGPLQLLPASPVPQTSWTAFSLLIPIPIRQESAAQELAALALYLRLPSGTLYIDNLTFTIDGKPYAPTGPPVAPPPTAAEVAWLRTASRPLRLATATTEVTDLAALAASLGAARVVGLGEVTHGSHEAYVLRDKLSRYLIGQKGFTALALDASPAACAALTAYLRTGQGDPARLLAALDGWNTTEMRDLLAWLRSYQQAHPATALTLAGLDIRQPEEAVASLRQLLEPEDAFAQSRLRQVAQLLAAYPHPAADDPDLRHPDQPQDSLLAPLHRLLAELATGLDARAKLRARPTSLAELARHRHYLRLVEQGATWRRLAGGPAFNYYQACLADNAQYLSQTTGPGGAAARLIIWASNSAVAKALTVEERPMGEWLRATLGPGYAALGLVLGQGRFAALGPAGQWASAPLAVAPTGSYEAWLRTTPGPASWLAPGRAELTDDNPWLFQQQLLREVGYRAAHNEFMLHSLRSEFDVVVFWRDSTPAHFLPAGR